MTALVFLGPSLPVAEAKQISDALYLPPAAQGDVYRAVKQYKPRVVAIVDGYFRQLPSVWHKEILWTMKQGVHAVGGASMGALRAAELSHFGMEGIGNIFLAYQCGRFEPFDTDFEDDDEVAVVHGPAEVGYVSASVAMVNIRATLAQAYREGVIQEHTLDRLAAIAKSLFYPERSYKNLLANSLARSDLNKTELEALEAWLATGIIDQKQQDARAVLERVQQLLESGVGKKVDFHFEHTDLWQGLTEDSTSYADRSKDPVLQQLRIEPQRYKATHKAAHYRRLAITEAQRRGLQVSNKALRDYRTLWRQAMGLFDGASFQSWLESNDLDQAELDRLLEDDLRLSTLHSDPDLHLDAEMLDELKLGGSYPALSAQVTQSIRSAQAKAEPQLCSDEGRCMLDWYFTTIAEGQSPLDLHAYAVEQGFVDLQAFTRSVWGAYLESSANCK